MDWTKALRVQHLNKDIKRLKEDLQTFNTSLRHKTNKYPTKKIEESKSGLLARQTVCAKKHFLSRPTDDPDQSDGAPNLTYHG